MAHRASTPKQRGPSAGAGDPIGGFGLAHQPQQPPPSTVAAAQLADSISTSTRSSASRSNQEQVESERIFAEIHHAKHNPAVLRSPEAQLAHNHMLTYIFARTILDEVARIDDPFMDHDKLRSQTQRAFEFFSTTFRETPLVLFEREGATAGQPWLFRGTLPLWAWFLPKVLQVLGRPTLGCLADLIESFFVDFWSLASQVGALWDLVPPISLYLREIANHVIGHLREVQSARTVTPSVRFELPQTATLEGALDGGRVTSDAFATYKIANLRHAIRHAAGVLAILSLAPSSTGCAPDLVVSDHVPWLMDTLLDLYAVQQQWDPSSARAVRLALDLLRRQGDSNAVRKSSLHKAYTLLMLLCTELAASPDELCSPDARGAALRTTYFRALVELARGALTDGSAISRAVASKPLDLLERLPELSPLLFGPGTDAWRCIRLLRHVATTPLQPPDDDICAEKFADAGLSREVRSLGPGSVQDGGNLEPQTKRRRKTGESTPLRELNDQIYAMLDVQPDDDIVCLEHIFLSRYVQLDEPQKCHAINLLSRTPCAADGTAILQHGTGQEQDSASWTCSFCNAQACATVSRPPCHNAAAKKEAEIIFSKVLTDASFMTSSPRVRVVAMIALRKLASHSINAGFLNLETSGPGQKCLQSLSSSVRELRIAGGRALTVFLREEADRALADVVARNRKNAFGFLKTVAEKNGPELDETCILAWGQIGRIVKHDELNLVLIKLLEYLGNTNHLVSAFAFNELLNLADARKTTPRRLLEPFWRSLAYLATKDMVARPQMSAAIADLLQLSVNDLLLLIQSHALPWLVLERKTEAIQRIADARHEKDIWRPIIDPANLSTIVAVLLVQDTENMDTYVMTSFTEISPHFLGLSLLDVLRMEPALTAMELLKAAGEADETRKIHIRNAITVMSSKLVAPAKKSDKKHTKTYLVGRFLQPHILNFMARLTEVFNDNLGGGSPPVLEQRRCLNAMEEMIRLAKGYARVARPQVSACLLSAFGHEDLREAAFSCWSALLTYLETEDVEALLETTFFIINRHWNSFSQRTMADAKELLHYLLGSHAALITSYIHKLSPLGHISALVETAARFDALRTPIKTQTACRIFASRLQHENSGVVLQALMELVGFLKRDGGLLQRSAGTEQPDPSIATLMRALLDCATKYGSIQPDIGRLCAECVGLVGCLDSNRIETVRVPRSMVVLENFESSVETTDFCFFLLEEVLTKSFLSTTDTKLQGFLSYAMQELLEKCDVKSVLTGEAGDTATGGRIHGKWMGLPATVREVLTPFVTSGYRVAPMAHVAAEYPLFRPGKQYGNWLRAFVLDLLHRPQNTFAEIVFAPLCRVIRVKDLSVAEFLLPYLVVHVLVGEKSMPQERDAVVGELMAMLEHQPTAEASYVEREDAKRFCAVVFHVLDYSMRWIQARNASPVVVAGAGSKNAQEQRLTKDALRRIETVLDSIPAELISRRAVDYGEYSRALFYLERHVQAAVGDPALRPDEWERLLGRLQDIYTHIDEPDGLVGVSAHLRTFDINQQILVHRKAGRWTEAKAWYEMQIAQEPASMESRIGLLHCLKQSGQYHVLLDHVEGMGAHGSKAMRGFENKVMPFAVEAAWATGRWDSLQRFTARFRGSASDDFNISVAVLFGHMLGGGGGDAFQQALRDMRDKLAASMTMSATASLQACHDLMLKCHVLTDLELIVGSKAKAEPPDEGTLASLERRLHVIGAYVHDKQYVLGIRRAAMELMRPKYSDLDISSLWVTTARLARKGNSLQRSFDAVLQASRLGDGTATIENARLLWKEGERRKAIQVLQGAIDSNVFLGQAASGADSNPSALPVDASMETTSMKTTTTSMTIATTTAAPTKGVEAQQQALLTAQAQLLLAKWLDHAGQTQASTLRDKYLQPAKMHTMWEKPHYYLGRYYKKVLESEQNMPAENQGDSCLTGEITRVVIENYLKSLYWGVKHLHQTLPCVLTLWLEFGAQVNRAPEMKLKMSTQLNQRRCSELHLLHQFMDRYISRLPAYMFYTALPQVVARITHPHLHVFERLAAIIVKVVEQHPRQAVWALSGLMTSRETSDRKARGQQILDQLKAQGQDMKALLRSAQKLAQQLLDATRNGSFASNKSSRASLARDLRFNASCVPCPLVVPVESYITATLPAATEHVRRHKPFSDDVVSIARFADEVLVLGSLAKPRRLTAVGSDGRKYMLLIKPKDDLRTDQRLMEFNNMINRSLKRGTEASRRQLYIRTYAVTPINEDAGIIEWVAGIKTMREILLALYASRGIHPDYNALKQLLAQATAPGNNTHIFSRQVLGMFPPVLQLWFVRQFPDPAAWFSARLRYTRSTAVMSMVGHILGLGDRHGENLCLEQGTGGIFHVDFNCLFDKGLTFQQPEKVPFRLTHNMVAAMGVYGYEGPFRQSCELTLAVLRQGEETLMTILEAFIYDPTLELRKASKGDRLSSEIAAATTWGGGRTAAGRSAVEGIRRKVKGLLPDESIPLSVEGHVDVLIKQAVDPKNLASMYIGWMSFL